VPKKVDQINDHLFIDTYMSNNIKIGVNDMTANDSENVCEMKRRSLVNTGVISVTIQCSGISGCSVRSLID